MSPEQQVLHLEEARKMIAKVRTEMENYSAFDEASEDVSNARKLLIEAGIKMRKAIRDRNRG